MSDWPWVVSSYALTWIVLGGYGFFLHRGRTRAGSELEAARRGLDRSVPQGNQEVEG